MCIYERLRVQYWPTKTKLVTIDLSKSPLKHQSSHWENTSALLLMHFTLCWKQQSTTYRVMLDSETLKHTEGEWNFVRVSKIDQLKIWRTLKVFVVLANSNNTETRPGAGETKRDVINCKMCGILMISLLESEKRKTEGVQKKTADDNTGKLYIITRLIYSNTCYYWWELVKYWHSLAADNRNRTASKFKGPLVYVPVYSFSKLIN